MAPAILARFSTPGEAEMARSALVAAGIDVMIADEELVSLNWLYSNAIGGIKLVVEEADLERAAAVLSNPGIETTEEVTETPVVEEEPEVLVCPSCGSDQIARVPRLKLFFLFMLVLYGAGVAVDQQELALAGIFVAAVITFFAPSHRCIACAEKFNGVEPERKEAAGPPPEASDTFEEPCPRCGSLEFHHIAYRKLKSIPLLFNASIVLLAPLWLFLPKKQCDACGFRA